MSRWTILSKCAAHMKVFASIKENMKWHLYSPAKTKQTFCDVEESAMQVGALGVFH